MEKLVKYPPQNPGEYSNVETYALGIIPVRVVVSRRIDGWCAYLLLRRMPIEFYYGHGIDTSKSTPWELVRDNGDKIPEQYARELLPDMEGPYAY
jgi:hypothetical protein